MTVARPNAVRAGIATADHDHMFSRCEDLPSDHIAGIAPILLRQEIHCKVHPRQVAPRNRQIAGLLRPTRQHHRVEGLQQLRGRPMRLGEVWDRCVPLIGRLITHQYSGHKRHALGLHLLHPTIDLHFFKLEIRDAIAQQAADAIVLLKHRHRMANAGELLRRC